MIIVRRSTGDDSGSTQSAECQQERRNPTRRSNKLIDRLNFGEMEIG